MSQVGIWGWDTANTKWVKVLVDNLGHLQVDTLSSALPTGAATAAHQITTHGYIDNLETLLAGGLPAALDALGGLKVVNYFGGATYVNSDTAVDNDARRFEAASKKLRDVILIVKTHDQLFGDSGGQTYPVAVDETIGFTKVDISTLYFKNATDGEDGTVHILGVEL